MRRRIGVFICWCGSNIGDIVNVPQAVDTVSQMPLVYYCTDYKYMCSEPGQNTIINAIREHGLDRVVVAACTPRLHEATFRRALERAGLNPYMLEIANIREQCAWVHQKDKEGATEKAIAIIKRAVGKAAEMEPLYPSQIAMTKKTLVVGGGIAGIQAALDIADAGHEVLLLEREPTIGGKMAMLDKTFPTLDCSA